MKRSNKPLTPAMQAVVEKMRDGWEYAHTSGHDWIQKGKIGHGGECIQVNGHTAFGLFQRGAFRQVRKLYYGGAVFHLSERFAK
jgi:hypothetical protein